MPCYNNRNLNSNIEIHKYDSKNKTLKVINKFKF